MFLTLTLPLAALAQDGGTRTGAGFELEPPFARDLLGIKAVWVDEPRLIGLPVNLSGQPLDTARCYTLDGGFVQSSTELAPYQSNVQAPPSFGVRPGSSEVIIIASPTQNQSALIRASCSGAAANLGLYTFPAGLSPFVAPLTLPMDSSGAVYYPSANGIAKLALAGTPIASLVVPTAELRATVEPPAGAGMGAFRIEGFIVTPDDRLVLVAKLNDPGNAGSWYWVIERSAVGAFTVIWKRHGNLASSITSAWDATTPAALVSGLEARQGIVRYDVLGVVSPATRPIVDATFPAWPAFTGNLLGSFGGRAHLYAADVIRRLRFDPALADFDRDGLRAQEETALGTSDVLADSDGDGVPDLAEVRRFLTSPIDAGSVPDVSVDAESVLGASLLTSEGLALGDPGCRGSFGLSWARLVCEFGCGGNSCVDPSLKKVTYPAGARRFPEPVPDGGVPSIVYTQNGNAWATRNTVTNFSLPFTTPFTGPDIRGAVPLNANTALFFEHSSNGFERMWRVGASGGTAFAVIDRRRVTCPIMGNAAALAACAAPINFLAEVTDAEPVGFDPQTKRVLVRVGTNQGRSLYGVGANEIEFVADLTAVLGGLEVENIVSLGEAGLGGYLTQETISTLVSNHRFNRAFGVVASTQPVTGGRGLGPLFRLGHADVIITAYLTEPGPVSGGCMSGGGVFVCDSAPPAAPKYITRAFSAEWIPVLPSLEKGELLFWSARRFQGGATGPGLLNPRTGQFEGSMEYTRPGWLLWRVSPAGAVVEWLTRPEFEAMLSVADKAELALTPLGAIGAMSASADALKVCLAEPAAGRVWELLLDPVSRRLSGTRLASKRGGAGCAYDEAGGLAVLKSGPTALVLAGGAVVAVADVAVPNGLLRVNGRWIVQAYQGGARCLDDLGAVTNPKIAAVAMSSAPGGLAYVDEGGNAFATTTERFCGGQAPLDRLVKPPFTLWSKLYLTFTFRTVNATRAVLAVRPDGVVFAGASEVQVAGLGAEVQTVTNALFYLFPHYGSVNGVDRLTANDAVRLVDDVAAIGSVNAGHLEAMTILPGAIAGREWGYVRRPGTPTRFVPQTADAGVNADGGVADGGTMPAPTPRGCGCASAESSVLLALALLARLGRRHRRVRTWLGLSEHLGLATRFPKSASSQVAPSTPPGIDCTSA